MSDLTLPFKATVAATNADTIFGIESSSGAGTAISGESYGADTEGDWPIGVYGETDVGQGVWGQATTGVGVQGQATTGVGISGTSQGGNGVQGTTGDGNSSGVIGVNSGGGNGVYGTSASGNAVAGKSQTGNAGWFDGPVYVNGAVTVKGDIVLTGADCAEEFDVIGAAEMEPGTVVVMDQNGAMRSSQRAYDKKVAGVISGAGDYRPGMILDRKDASRGRMPIALIGKVYCKVDARYSPVEVGDLLTTSSTPGHAMRASDPMQAFGAVLGKALRGLPAGQGLIPVLVALQ
jgi:hypothetical protein